MPAILEAVRRFFDEDEWTYQETPSGLRLHFGDKNGEWRCFARIREAEGQLIFYSYAPVTIEADQSLQVIEYISRANSGMHIGNFELNFENGMLQFRTSIDVEGEEASLSSQLIKHLVYQNVLTMDRYLPGLYEILDGRLTPEDAIHWIEA